MVFDVESLTPEEMLATKTVLETITCTHPAYACVDCPCFEICVFLRDIHDKCSDLQSAYHYMIAKVFRDFAEDQSIKIDPLELELLDS